jgi:hypothetical protein
MAITMVFALLVVFLFFALSLDAGIWYFDHRWAQNQAESAALAAAVELPLPASGLSAATTRADAWLARNGSSSAERSCLEYSNGHGRLDGQMDTVRVCVRRAVPSIFAALASVPFAWVSAGATATVVEEPTVYALMAMNDDNPCDDSTLLLNGGAIVNITMGGGSYTRSSCTDGLHVEGTSQLHSGVSDTLTGSARVNGSTALLDPPASQREYLEDPYASLRQPIPTASGSVIGGCGNINVNDATLNPGTYCGQVRINGTVTLNPGTYIFLNGLVVNSTARVTGSGVLLYSTCQATRANSPAQCGGSATAGDLEFAGGAQVNITGSTSYLPECSVNPGCPNMAIWVDRTSRQSNPDHPHVRFRGNTAGGVNGRVYDYRGTVDIGGDPGVTMTLNMSIVADHIQFQGNATFNMPFNPILAPSVRTMSLSD